MKLLRIILAILLGLNGFMVGVVVLLVLITGNENILIPAFGLVVSVKLLILIFLPIQIVLGVLFNLLASGSKKNDSRS